MATEMWGDPTAQMMMELTVVFGNDSIPNAVYLTGPFDMSEVLDIDSPNFTVPLQELREQAEVALGAPLDDAQCFYRFMFRK